MTDYRLTNEGEEKPTGVTGSPLGKEPTSKSEPGPMGMQIVSRGHPLTAAMRPAVLGAPPLPTIIEGSESRPTREDENPAIDYTKPRPTVPPAHDGVIAAYTDKSGNKFMVDVYRMNRSWAFIRIMHAPLGLRMLIGRERKVGPDKVKPIESGDLFWWHLPSYDHYDYRGKLQDMRDKALRGGSR